VQLFPEQAVWASTQSVFHRSLWVQHVVPLWLKWIQVQLFPESWAGGTGQCSVYLS
jgi:hypothetical protein